MYVLVGLFQLSALSCFESLDKFPCSLIVLMVAVTALDTVTVKPLFERHGALFFNPSLRVVFN